MTVTLRPIFVCVSALAFLFLTSCSSTSSEGVDLSAAKDQGAPQDQTAPLSDGGCPGGKYFAYGAPGCDGTVVPACYDLVDLAAWSYCACNGQTVVGGGDGPSVPWASHGLCARDMSLDM